jgi:hypothetical protein
VCCGAVSCREERCGAVLRCCHCCVVPCRAGGVLLCAVICVETTSSILRVVMCGAMSSADERADVC